MKPRFVVAFCALSFFALFSFAKEPRWYKQPGTPVTLESAGFELRVMLPKGWTYTEERGFVPPPAFASSCRVRGGFYTEQNWDSLLVPALRSTDGMITGEDGRMVLKVAGHPAVSNRYVRGPFLVRDIYINLSELQPDSGAVWTFEGNLPLEGADCELQFLAMINSARITRSR